MLGSMDSGSDWERYQACVQAGCTQLVSCYSAVLSMENNKFDRFVLASLRGQGNYSPIKGVPVG